MALPATQIAHPKALVLAEREIVALRLRAQGMSYRKIAVELDISHAQAHADVQKGYSVVREEMEDRAREAWHMELHRLEEALRPIEEMLNDSEAKPDIRLRAHQEWIRNHQARARLYGLEQVAPELHLHQHNLTVQVRSKLEERIEELAERRQAS